MLNTHVIYIIYEVKDDSFLSFLQYMYIYIYILARNTGAPLI